MLAILRSNTHKCVDGGILFCYYFSPINSAGDPRKASKHRERRRTNKAKFRVAMGRAKKQKLEPISAKRIKGSPRTEPKESLPKSFKIIVGTYEKLLYGLDARVSRSSGKPKLQFSLSPVFAFPAHVSCIKAVAASPHGGKWLATGSADEIIKVWDLRRRKEVGGLMHHQGKALLV